MDQNIFVQLLQLAGSFGILGVIPLTVWVVSKAKLARLRLERELQQNAASPQDSVVLAELRAMRQEMAEMQNTSHQFDLSFDESLSRLEGRVGRLETKSAASTVAAAPTEEIQRAGLR